MAFTTTSTNMLLPVPVVGVEPGPQYATDVNNCLAIIDQHNHQPGSGVQITPAGLNINSDLPIGSNNLTLVKTVRFTPQSAPLTAPADLGCIYEVNADLYYNDGIGNTIRMTQNGSIAGTSGSIANLVAPASASYSSATKTFIFQSDVNTPANIDGASYILRNLVANSPKLTLSPPNAMSSDSVITLPTLPAQTNIMTMDSLGNIVAGTNVDNTSIDILNNNIEIKPAGVTTAKIADLNVTRPKLAAVGQQISASSGVFTTTSTSYLDVTNLSVTITTTGRPVMLMLVGDGNPVGAGGSYIGATNNAGTGSALGAINFVRDSTILTENILRSDGPSGSSPALLMPPSAQSLLDTPAAGTYTYKVQVINGNGNTIMSVFYNKLVAYEL